MDSAYFLSFLQLRTWVVRKHDQITFLSIEFIWHSTGAYEMGGQSGLLPTQVLADQLTLYQSEGSDCAHHITASPPSFW